jgi:N-acetylneuraminate synthase/N,N'-diacetyllegionaminate synthase
MAFAPHIEIEGRRIGPGEPCLVIAEAGVAHFGQADKAAALVDLAADGCADVFKTQHYRTDLLVGPSSPEWRERLRLKEVPDSAVAAMQTRCKEKGITFLCTPHDAHALNFLDRELKVSAFKIGSGEIENWPFLADVASRGKPVILSTGMYTLDQIRCAVEVAAEAGCRELAVLHCVTSYPAEPGTINLDVMRQIRGFFTGPVGYSDHTVGTAVPLAAVALAADIIEKHITLDRDVPNAHDWKVSCDPSNFATFVADIRAVEAARGGESKTVADVEQRSALWARKSLTACIDIPAGASLTTSMLIAQRPGTGLPASKLPQVLGRKTARALRAGEILTEDLLA